MRKIREILRLKYEKDLTNREIAQSIGVSSSTVSEHLARAMAANISWPLDDVIDDAFLNQYLFASKKERTKKDRPLPDWSEIRRQLQQKGVTLQLLWQEYKSQNVEGLQYSQFCERYRQWEKEIEPVMRQLHPPGEKLFVDYAGMTVPISNMDGSTFDAQIFVATLGASNYTYVEATLSQSVPDWIESHIRAFEFFAGVPKACVCDNLKSGVKKPCRYDPDISPVYFEMAKHYGIAILPARVRKPKDKAKVENGVLQVERRILAPLRHQKFFSISELNESISKLLVELNEKPFQKLDGSRRSWFEKFEKDKLAKLPSERFEIFDAKLGKVHIDYHVELERHYYSVPYRLVRKEVELRYSSNLVKIYHGNLCVAIHRRCYTQGAYTTVREHMPSSHRFYSSWSRERLVQWARKSGVATAEVSEKIIASKVYPEAGFKAVLGVIQLGKKYGNDRLESACRRVLQLGAPTYKSVKSILATGLDQKPLESPMKSKSPELTLVHPNIRGRRYFETLVKERNSDGFKSHDDKTGTDEVNGNGLRFEGAKPEPGHETDEF